MTDEFEYDPEKTLWRPGRRSFLSMMGAAFAGLVVPSGVVVPTEVTAEQVAEAVHARVVLNGYSSYADLIRQVYSRDRIFAPFERDLTLFRSSEKYKGKIFKFEGHSDPNKNGLYVEEK